MVCSREYIGLYKEEIEERIGLHKEEIEAKIGGSVDAIVDWVDKRYEYICNKKCK